MKIAVISVHVLCTTMHQLTVLFEATCVHLHFGACWVIFLQCPRSNYKLKLQDLANFKFPYNLLDVDLSIAVGRFCYRPGSAAQI